MPKLCVIPGDGIGLEVIPAAVQVLEKTLPDLEVLYAEAGWNCFQEHGVSVLPQTLETIRNCGAALFGAVSSPAHKVQGYRSAILTLRQELDLFANLRPVHSLPVVSPRTDIDMILVRENSEGLYSGLESIQDDRATATRVITRKASFRIAEQSMQIMKLLNRKKLSIIHKANVLPLTDGLFRDTVCEVVSSYEQQGFRIEVEEILVDVAAYKMLSDPQKYDVLVTTNLFGDILSDAAAYWCGGLGMAPSLNLGEGIGLAEPVHGSAPDIAGKGLANPIAAILSAALLVRFVWQQQETANRIETAVNQSLREFGDLGLNPAVDSPGTQAILDRILSNL
ncbi:MAG TPA: isocitrate/isopropylmalate dehydrogenase family protein [Anaerolineaceae bacterium]|nr:isocitrate/isopropylmalate dehydrogenase family protein [Anaerolineaceae bacterium]